MSFIKRFDKDQNKQSGSGILGGGTPSQQGTGGQQSAWTNLQQYIGANQGAGAGIANAITESTQKDVDAVGAKQGEFEKKAKEKADASTRKDTFSNQIKADPTKVDQGAFSAWKNLGNYWGANNANEVEGYEDVLGATRKAQADAQSATDYYGQKALADRTFGGQGNYSQGMNTLDVFVANADDSGKQAFQSFRDRNSEAIGTKWNDALSRTNEYIGGAANRGQQAMSNVQGAIGEKRTGLYGSAQTRADANTDKTPTALELKNAAPAITWQYDVTPYISRNENYGADDAFDDYELQALNALAQMENQGPVTRGTDKAYIGDQDKLNEWLNKAIGVIGAGGNSTPASVPQGTNGAPPPAPPIVGPTPTPTPQPVPVPVGPTPAPTPSPSPLPPPPTVGGILSGTGGLNGGDPRLSPQPDTGHSIDYSGPRPAGWPSNVPWPPPWI